VSVCNTINFESSGVESSCFGLRVHPQPIRVKFVHEGRRVKVTVTRAKKSEIPYFRNVKLRWTIKALFQKKIRIIPVDGSLVFTTTPARNLVTQLWITTGSICFSRPH